MLLQDSASPSTSSPQTPKLKQDISRYFNPRSVGQFRQHSRAQQQFESRGPAPDAGATARFVLPPLRHLQACESGVLFFSAQGSRVQRIYTCLRLVASGLGLPCWMFETPPLSSVMWRGQRCLCRADSTERLGELCTTCSKVSQLQTREASNAFLWVREDSRNTRPWNTAETKFSLASSTAHLRWKPGSLHPETPEPVQE